MAISTTTSFEDGKIKIESNSNSLHAKMLIIASLASDIEDELNKSDSIQWSALQDNLFEIVRGVQTLCYDFDKLWSATPLDIDTKWYEGKQP